MEGMMRDGGDEEMMQVERGKDKRRGGIEGTVT